MYVNFCAIRTSGSICSRKHFYKVSYKYVYTYVCTCWPFKVAVFEVVLNIQNINLRNGFMCAIKPQDLRFNKSTFRSESLEQRASPTQPLLKFSTNCLKCGVRCRFYSPPYCHFKVIQGVYTIAICRIF